MCGVSRTQVKFQISSKSSRSMSPPHRKKASRPKTTTGCKTCRIRRIKCDEAEPSCSQCLRGRRICEGYPHKLFVINHRKSSVSMSTMDPTSFSDLFKTDQERRCFEFFRWCTVPQLSGSFESPFWTHLLLLATHHEPAIQHAAIALGALHECFEQQLSNQAEANLSFALRQYVRAIGLVTNPIRERGTQAADVALMTCVLFVCFETLRGYHTTALSHINGGIKIVSELQSQYSTKSSLYLSHIPYAPLPILNQVFMRLDAQASQIDVTRRRRLLCQNTSTKDSGYNPDIPPSFSSLEEARNSLEYIRTCADRTAQSLPLFPPNRQTITSFSPAVITKTKLSLDLIRNVSAIKLKQWSSVFESFLRDKQDLTVVEQRAARILRLHRMMMGVHLSIDFFRIMDDEMVWDEYYQEFETIVEQAEIILQLSPISKRPSFTLDTEVIMPLASVIIKCRDRQVRRKAIALLRSTHRQEGVWNSLLIARVTERVMEIEEDGLDGEMGTAMSIPRWNRVEFQIKLDNENRRANLQYEKFKEDGGMETGDEWLEWSGLGAQ